MPAPGAGGVQTSLVGTVQSMMASARRVPPQAATRATTRRARPEPGRRQEQPGRSQPIRRRLRTISRSLCRGATWIRSISTARTTFIRTARVAVEMLRVIGAAMAEAGVVGLARLTLSRRERMVVVEPRGTGMALFTLRAAEEVRAAQFGMAEGELDAEMVAIAKAIITQRTGSFDPTTYRDRYQEALQELIEAKMKGLTVKP